MSHMTDSGHVQPVLGPAEMAHINQEILQRVTALIQLGVGVLNGLICLRYLLKLMGANPGNPIAQFSYSTTQPLLSMFQGVISTLRYEGMVFEFYDLIAIVVYAMLGWIAVQL